MNICRASVHNPVAVNLIMWFTVVVGVYYWNDLVREFFPSLDTEQVSISIAYPGATPEDVERAITLRIERRLRDIDGVEEIASTVLEGMSVVMVKLEPDADKDRILNEIRSDIDLVKADFPREADDPEILEIRPYIPVVSVVVAGDVPEERLRDEALSVRDDILDLGGISEVNLVGRRTREIWAKVRPEKLEEHGLTFEEVGRAVGAANVDLPGGQLKSNAGNIRLRTMGESRRALALEEIAVATRADGSVVRLRDVAELEDTFEDRVMRGRFGGERALQLVIFKTPEQDALEISEKVKTYVAGSPSRLGGAIELHVTTDLARFIDQRLDLMVRNARAGLILVLLTLTIFLSIRTAFWVAVGLPVALLGSFALMAWMGASINLLSLFSLIVVLGLIVDDAVVIGESVHTRLKRGDDPKEAAWKGASEVSLPVVAAVLTSILAFLPMAFMDGIWGDFLEVL
ncbi:MAG: efflux RND transporter permease subunit, partial [Planctomycetota bacterium JB042]